MSNLTAFFAYAAHPREIGEAIERAVGLVNERGNILVRSWTALDIVGQFISDRVLEGIDNADILIADISVLNFNVTYEIGYAIGRGKRVLLTKNTSVREMTPSISDVGIFDTIGYKTYQNSNDLVSFISDAVNLEPLVIGGKNKYKVTCIFVGRPSQNRMGYPDCL